MVACRRHAKVQRRGHIPRRLPFALCNVTEGNHMKKYPTIQKAMALIENDCGSRIPVQLINCENLKLDEERYEGKVNLKRVEKFLASLTAAQLQQFAIGDLEDEKFVKIWSKPDGLMANAFLDYCFAKIGE
jgi:hypothetical protein